MDRQKAKKIINSNNLIQGKVGRKILLAIKNNTQLNQNDLPGDVTLNQVEQLKVLYQKKSQEIESHNLPSNYVFYHLIKDSIPEFSWRVEDKNVAISAPKIENLRLSLLSLLLKKIKNDDYISITDKYPSFQRLPKEIIKTIDLLLEEIKVIYPSNQNVELIINWLEAGLRGEEVTIFSPVCPDYSVEPTDDPERPYRHTFNELGAGNGLIAQRILAALPIIIGALNKCGIYKIKIIVGLGDFEAYSASNLTRLKITKEEFLERVAKSKDMFEVSCTVQANVYMITDLFENYSNWHTKYELILNELKENNYGQSNLNEIELLKIVKKRKNLYDRWYGKKSLKDHIPQVLIQGAEYAVLTEILSKFKNCLVIGADNDAMGPFYSMRKITPTLYLKRFYY